jgi:hypothetical protein
VDAHRWLGNAAPSRCLCDREQGAGAKLVVDHAGFPAGAGDHLSIGWKLNYWEPLEKLLADKQ